ncbi:hypothetical protein GEV38_25550 [Pseudomonas sp. 13159349]|nr:hypothetical protein GEV38_25550 [Pseudomonas sp. 13159349]
MLGGLGSEKEFALAGLGCQGHQQEQGEQQSEHAGNPGNRRWILRGHARSHRYGAQFENCAVPVGAGVPANGLQSSPSALSYLSRRNQGACRCRE